MTDDNLPLVGYLIAVSAILRSEGREEWSDRISLAASKINKMQDEIEKLRAALKPFADAAEHIGAGWGDDDSVGVGHAVGDLRAAAAAIREGSE